MLRLTSSRAIAIALTLGTVATASAQDPAPRRSRSQLPVKKEQPATPPTESTPSSGSTTSSMPPVGRDTVLVGRSDTTIVMCNCATTQTASAGEVLPLIPARIQRFFGNGLYVGVASGAMLPVGDLMNSYNPGGWGVNVPIGWDPKASPLGVRVNLGYAKFESASPAEIVNDAKQWNAALDAKLRVPFGRFLGASSGAYLVGGGAMHHFTNYNESIYRSNNFVNTRFSTPANNSAVISQSNGMNSSATHWGIHGGLGLSMGVGPAELFAESRYTRVYTPGRAINYVPIVAGVTFH
jgi:hypothetical protein